MDLKRFFADFWAGQVFRALISELHRGSRGSQVVFVSQLILFCFLFFWGGAVFVFLSFALCFFGGGD